MGTASDYEISFRDFFFVFLVWKLHPCQEPGLTRTTLNQLWSDAYISTSSKALMN